MILSLTLAVLGGLGHHLVMLIDGSNVLKLIVPQMGAIVVLFSTLHQSRNHGVILGFSLGLWIDGLSSTAIGSTSMMFVIGAFVLGAARPFVQLRGTSVFLSSLVIGLGYFSLLWLVALFQALVFQFQTLFDAYVQLNYAVPTLMGSLWFAIFSSLVLAFRRKREGKKPGRLRG